MQIGIIGLPATGKTTVFNALTRQQAQIATYSAEPNRAIVKVPDARLDQLTELFQPRKSTPATVEYIDVAGITPGEAKGGGLSPQFLANMRNVDALMHVVRVFDDPNVPHVQGSTNPRRDIETMDLELAFADLAIIEKRIERLEQQTRFAKAKGAEREAAERETTLLERLKAPLEAGGSLRDVELAPDEEKSLRGFQFLTAKPLLIVLNLGESQLANADAIVAQVRSGYQHRAVAIVALCGQLEMELGQLDPSDAAVFMADLGITQLARGEVIRLSYELLGLISFFTVGQDECRAWTIRRGTIAVEAAGEIHSDLQRGFIRGEVVPHEDLLRLGSLAETRKAGVLRQEGKTYVVKDGDILHVLFNV